MEEIANTGNIDLVQLTKTELSPTTGEEILVVDLDAVGAVLGNPVYKDHYVAIYTIAGPTRSGKSFLFSLFWKFLYLSKQENSYEKWSSDVENVKRIFNWRKGPTPCTQGIFILKEPIVISFKNKKIALFLMDTQGIFDNETSDRNQSFLGTFSFLLSSFTLFNVDKGIKSTDFEAIFNFAKNLRNGYDIFLVQKESLMFVVRDWISSDESDDDSNDDNGNQNFSYGTESGKKYFEILLRNSATRQAQKHEMTRRFLKFAFGEASCCLLPHPGKKVARTSFSVADLSDDFRRETFKFFKKIEDECQVRIKKTEEELCKCAELCEIIKDYVSQLGHDLQVPDDGSAIVKDFRVKMSRNVKKCVEEFKELSNKQKVWKGDYEAVGIYEHYLKKLKADLKKRFRQEVIDYYSKRAVDEWELELDRVLSQAIKILMTCVHVDKEYKNAILTFSDWLKNNANSHLNENSNFKIQTREKRSLLLEKLRENIRQQVADADLFAEIFLQCNEYFINQTNKIIANIDDDIESFLRTIRIGSVAVIVSVTMLLGLPIIGIGAAIGAGLAVAAPVLAITAGEGAAIVAGASTVATATSSIEYTISRSGKKFRQGAKMLVSKLAQPSYIKRMQNQAVAQIDKNQNKIFSHALCEFEEGTMEVKLRFGQLKFKLEIKDNLLNMSSQPSSSAE